MIANRLKQLLVEGKTPVGHMISEFGTRGIAKLLEAAGMDFAVIDMEHAGYDSSEVADLMALFKATPVTPIVRVPEMHYHFIARTLDAGAAGIMMPNVLDGRHARAVVDAAKYAPMGKRGVMLGGAHTDYLVPDPGEFLEFSNTNTTIICQIESTEALKHVDEIAGTPGVDILWVGQYDLSTSMGIPGKFHNKDFLAALEYVVQTARAHGLGAAIQPGDLEQAGEWIDIGFNVISYSMDMQVYLQALLRSVEEVRKLARQV